MADQIISSIVKEYPHMFKVVIYHESYLLPSKTNHTKNTNKVTKKEDNIQRSLRRSKTTVQDIILSNDFDLWCTFTFDKRKLDRYNSSKCKSVMSNWLFNQRTHSPDLKYIIVPEKHKDGAIHFHALISNYHGTLIDTGHKTKNQQTIYKAQSYKSGFTEFVKLDTNKEAIAKYITKQYLTKDMILFPSQKRFWASRNLIRPVSHINGIGKFRLQQVVKNFKPEYINQSYEVQYHPIVTPLDSNRQVSLIPELL